LSRESDVRLIGTLNNEQQGLTFSQFLHSKGIHHRLEVMTDNDWGSPNYGVSQCKVWIEEEDQVEAAQEWYEQFLANPLDPQFANAKPSILVAPPVMDPSTQESPKKIVKEPSGTLWEKQGMGPITRLILFICAALFILQEVIPPSKETGSKEEIVTFFSSPVDKALLYDFPHFYELLDTFLQRYGYEALKHPEELSAEGKGMYNILNKTPYWQGYYDMIMEQGFKNITDWKKYPPMFEKIREGEVWRIFTPALIHANIFHIFFNMIWLIVLGKQIEQRMKPFSYILFIFLLGIFSNTAQYLMSGPNFLGFSGVLMGMLTFIWMRQRNTPWEGYLLDRTTFIFMMVFVFGVAGLQLISFITEKTMQVAITPNIANTAHISGALGGLMLGKLNFFGWRRS
jgi:GlpG protein